MSNYSSWKVADLKEELSKRGISQTGLRLKQQFIDRLVQDDDSGKTTTSAATTTTVPEGSAGEKNGAGAVEPGDNKEASLESATTTQQQQQHQVIEETGEDAAPPIPESVGAEKEKGSREEKKSAGKPAEVAESEKKEIAKDQSPVPGGQEDTTEEPSSKPEAQVPQPVEQEAAKDSGDVEMTDADDEKERVNTPEVGPSQKEGEEEPAEKKEEKTKNGEAERPAQEKAPEPTEPTSAQQQSAAAAEPSSVSVTAEEVTEDLRKRKRRSVTPIPPAEEMAKKRIRSEQGTPHVVLVDNNNVDPMKAAATTTDETPARTKRSSLTGESRKKSLPDARFKGLFIPRHAEEPLRAASPARGPVVDEADVEPALHLATTALYVDGLMRPLQPASLRNHIVNLASTPGGAPDTEVVTEFYLDPIKSHCFVGLTDVSAASRVRSSLHGMVWPNERDRKALFVDFLPAEKLREWIDVEDRAGRGIRYGVNYHPASDGTFEATHEEIDPKATSLRRESVPVSNNRPPPSTPPSTGPRSAGFANRERERERERLASDAQKVERSHHPGQGFKALDDLFKSTVTKPKLYYLPVPREVVDRRLDRFDDLIRIGAFPRLGGDERRRITFEDKDFFVDNGPEFGRGGLARRGGGRGGGRIGGRGDSWRRER